MTYRDQLEFRIRKLTRAIEALADLGTAFNLTGGIVETLESLKHRRSELRRTISDGRRSCGECGHPMRQETFSAGGEPGARGYHICDEADCSAHRQIVRG